MTEELPYVKGRFFQCDCNWPYHGLHVGSVDPLADEPMAEWELYHPSVTFTVVTDCGDNGWQNRLRAAWALLRGRPYPLTEISINRDDWPDFVAHIKDIDDAAVVVRARVCAQR